MNFLLDSKDDMNRSRTVTIPREVIAYQPYDKLSHSLARIKAVRFNISSTILPIPILTDQVSKRYDI
jgi:hypothetical protein